MNNLIKEDDESKIGSNNERYGLKLFKQKLSLGNRVLILLIAIYSGDLWCSRFKLRN